MRDVADQYSPTLPNALDLPAAVLADVDRVTADLLAWALWYRDDLGLKPLPRGRGGKHPRVAWTPYQEQFPTDDDLATWFRDPDTTGIVTVLDGTGYVVLELDAATPAQMPAAVALMREAGIAVPHACPRVVSGSWRSAQFWFRTRRAIGRRVAALVSADGPAKAGGAQLDILGTGIVVLPPTPHTDTGRPYQWWPAALTRARVPELRR